MSFSSVSTVAAAAACSGCGLCQLVCPVWHQKRDVRLTPLGRTKALQHGAEGAVLAASIADCTLCGACEPVCPERIPLVDMILELRTSHPLARGRSLPAAARSTDRRTPGRTHLLAGRALGADPVRLNRVLALLGATRASDDGADIAFEIEIGSARSGERREQFVAAMRAAGRLIVAEGLLLHSLRRWLPGVAMAGLGEALSRLEVIRGKLRASDLYVVEPRAFHADHRRLIGHYDALRRAVGCAMNLDLQRMAIPTTAASAQHALGIPAISVAEQARWIIDGVKFERIVVEDVNDCAAFASVTGRPVLHLADLAACAT